MAPPLPPPLPPIPRRRGTPRQPSPDTTPSTPEPFLVQTQGKSPDKIDFEFPRSDTPPGTVSLRNVIGTYLSSPQASRATADKLFHILNRLRCLQHALKKYNAGLANPTPAFDQYWRRHTLNLLSGFGFLPGPEPTLVHIAGLDDLIARIEAIHMDTIHEARSLISKGLISFSALGELFRPDIPVKASILSGTATCVFRVTDAFYEERRNLFGSQKNFHVTMEVVVPVGDHFSIATFSEVVSAWSGVHTRSLADFAYHPVSDAERESLQSRAENAVKYGLGGAKYLAYSPGSFFLHSNRSQQTGAAMSRATNSSQSLTGGRIMVDMARGASLGHHPCQGVDEVTLAIIQLAGRYRQWMSKRRTQSEPSESDALVLWDQVPDEFVSTCWPALVGFSFTAKAWGHVLVDGLSPIDFQDQAFDRLVLSQERKQLIRAVVRSGTSSTPQTQDLIGGKQGGLIFLLHGPPGVGKTLTAEAIAEVLHRPLYYVTMGELGVTPDDLERRLTDVLDLCAEWNALAVLDEADVFLETRTCSDLVRNAMVCVMLRILEYHPGILFLTTNRVRSLDPAFESRITIAIRYEALGRAARAQVWKGQLDGVAGTVAPDIDCDELARQNLNGRQIKNAVRLALSLAVDQGVALTQSILLQTIEVTSLGRQNMMDDGSWDELVDK